MTHKSCFVSEFGKTVTRNNGNTSMKNTANQDAQRNKDT